METPSSTCDEGSELDARSLSDYGDFDDLDRPSRVRHRTRGGWYALPARVSKPPPPLLKWLSTTRRADGVVREGKAGGSGWSPVPRRKTSLSLAFDRQHPAPLLLCSFSPPSAFPLALSPTSPPRSAPHPSPRRFTLHRWRTSEARARPSPTP